MKSLKSAQVEKVLGCQRPIGLLDLPLVAPTGLQSALSSRHDSNSARAGAVSYHLICKSMMYAPVVVIFRKDVVEASFSNNISSCKIADEGDDG